MIEKTRARFSGGALHPLEPLDLAEGQEVLLSIETPQPSDSPDSPEEAAPSQRTADEQERTKEERMKRTMSSAGAWKGKVDGEELKRMIYEARRLGSRETPDP